MLQSACYHFTLNSLLCEISKDQYYIYAGVKFVFVGRLGCCLALVRTELSLDKVLSRDSRFSFPICSLIPTWLFRFKLKIRNNQKLKSEIGNQKLEIRNWNCEILKFAKLWYLPNSKLRNSEIHKIQNLRNSKFCKTLNFAKLKFTKIQIYNLQFRMPQLT